MSANTVLIKELELTDRERDARSDYFRRIVGAHGFCGGKGVTGDESGFTDCECRSVYDYVCALDHAGIPRGFWKVSGRKSLGESEVSNFSGDIGRTTELCSWVRAGVDSGLRAVYCRAEEVVEWKRIEMFRDGDTILMDRFLLAEILAVDDLDRISGMARSGLDFVLNSIRRVRDGGGIVITADRENRMKAEMSYADQKAKIGGLDFREGDFLESALEYARKFGN